MTLQFNFKNVIDLIVILSPYFINFFFLLISLINVDLKGLIFVIGALLSALFGISIRPIINSKLEQNADPVCRIFDTGFNSQYNSPSSTSLFYGYTIMYLLMGMMENKTWNYILLPFVLLMIGDIYITKKYNCSNILGIFVGLVIGLLSGVLYYMVFKLAGFNKLLFFGEDEKNQVRCSQPSKQHFKCSVYKNGVLVKDL